MRADERHEPAEHAEHAGHEEHHGHVTSVGIYLITYVLLVTLLGATVGIYYVPLGPLNNVAAVSIAVCKALLVVLFFMGTYWSSRLTWLWAGAGFVWLMIMFGTLGDYISRGWVRVTGW